ncbi:uncharacterized protein DMENIID0001_073240 [Sergentomyia squamirostris]
MSSSVCGWIETPVGSMVATLTSDKLLSKLEFLERIDQQQENINEAELRKNTEKDKNLKKIQHEMTEYFQGKRTVFSVPLAEPDHPLMAIPFGETWTYSQLAGHLGNPKAARHAGRICSTNNVVIIIPCHRVVSKSGAIKYGAGPERKTHLIDHEAKVIRENAKQ